MEKTQLTMRKARPAQPVLETLLVDESVGSFAHARREQSERHLIGWIMVSLERLMDRKTFVCAGDRNEAIIPGNDDLVTANLFVKAI